MVGDIGIEPIAFSSSWKHSANELIPYMVLMIGLKPTTSRLQVGCTIIVLHQRMVERKGVKPSTSYLQGRGFLD